MRDAYKQRRYRGRKVREHILAFELEHGPIPNGLVVHHINLDKRDNRVENLAAMPNGAHVRLHAAIRRAAREGVVA